MANLTLFPEEFLEHLVEFGATALELVGVIYLIIVAAKALIHEIMHNEDPLELAEGISDSLEFLMCGEVLKTATASGYSDYIALGAIILLRAMLAFEVRWDVKNKKKELKEQEEAGSKEAETKGPES